MGTVRERILTQKARLLRGTVLVIDPSSGSQGSMPGYTLLTDGKYSESGTLQVPLGDVSGRLRCLQEALLDNFRPDGLIIEYIPPFMQSRGSSFRTSGVVNLHRSVGVVLGCFGDRLLLEVAPASWKACAKKGGYPLKVTGEHADEYDSLLITLSVYQHLWGTPDRNLLDRIGVLSK